MRWSLIVVLAFASVAAAQQPPTRTPPPPGVDISAKDGDRILIEDDARIQVLRRRQATIRTIYSQTERLLIVLVDFSKPGEFPDGQVDWAYNFYQVEGDWPLGPRWDALTALFQMEGDLGRPGGLAFQTPQGLVHLVPKGRDVAPLDPAALAVLTHGGSSGSPRRGVSFEQAETMQLDDFVRSKASGATVSTTMPPDGSRVTGTAVVRGQFGSANSPLQKMPNIAPSPPLPAGVSPLATAVRPPPPQGQEISARDGDRIVVDDDARVEIVRQRQATVRAIVNHEQRTLILLADYAKPGELPDGEVDAAFNFYELEGAWPLPPRWEAPATLFLFEGDPQLRRGYALATPQGLLHLSPARLQTEKPELSAAAVLWYRGMTGGTQRRMSFANAEKIQVAEAAKRRSAPAKPAPSLVP
jgi:hypothetical protein